MSKRISRVLCAALIIALVLALTGTSALASISVKLNGTTKFYEKASTSAKYTAIKKGQKVTLTHINGNWGRVVKSNGKVGYVILKYLDRVTPQKAYAAKNTTVYKTASTANKLFNLSKGTAVYVLGWQGSFNRVQNAPSTATKKGYMKSATVTTTKPAVKKAATSNSYDADLAYKIPPASSSEFSDIPSSLRSSTKAAGSSNSSKIAYTIYVAQNQIGKPYSAYATMPHSFDCARYAYYCYGMAGADVQASSYGLGYDTRYKKIYRDDLKRGDMVIFNTDSGDKDLSDHVGIYLGSGYFLHASSVAKKVIISYMGCGYYYRAFSWGRRIFG